MLNALDLAGIPLHAVDRGRRRPGRDRRRPRGLQPRADRRLRRRRRARRRRGGRARDLRGRPRVEGRGPPRRPRRAAAPPRGDRRRLRARGSTTSPTPTTARSRPWCPNRPGIPFRVRKHTLMDLDAVALPAPSRSSRSPRPCTSGSRVEIFRGCTRGCRFCQAGMITRPVRERSIETIGAMVENGIRKTGFEEVGLLSLSQRRPLRDRRGRQGPRRPLRGHQRLAVAAQHPRRRLQHRPGQRVLPQRTPLGPDLRARGRHRSGCAR